MEKTMTVLTLLTLGLVAYAFGREFFTDRFNFYLYLPSAGFLCGIIAARITR